MHRLLYPIQFGAYTPIHAVVLAGWCSYACGRRGVERHRYGGVHIRTHVSGMCVGGGGEVRAMIDTMFCRCVRGCVRACVRVCVRTYVRACLCVRISSMAQAAAKVCGSLFFSVSPTEVQMLVTKARKYKF